METTLSEHVANYLATYDIPAARTREYSGRFCVPMDSKTAGHFPIYVLAFTEQETTQSANLLLITAVYPRLIPQRRATSLQAAINWRNTSLILGNWELADTPPYLTFRLSQLIMPGELPGFETLERLLLIAQHEYSSLAGFFSEVAFGLSPRRAIQRFEQEQARQKSLIAAINAL
jgi:hypothetical protein